MIGADRSASASSGTSSTSDPSQRLTAKSQWLTAKSQFPWADRLYTMSSSTSPLLAGRLCVALEKSIMMRQP